MRFESVEEAGKYLLGFSPEKMAGETYTLERMKELTRQLGNPQNDIPSVHIAGTSGKTSTSYYIRSLLQAHGKRTGLTSSPHIQSMTERVQVDGVPLDDDIFLAYLDEFLDIVEQWPDLQPTYFELLTAFAFWVFKKVQVDYMIIEVGLGGLLDATNVISSSNKVSVITPIGLDHTEILGNTLDEIAYQKAGIVTSNIDVFTCTQQSGAAHVIATACADNNARLHVVEPITDESVAVPIFQQQNYTLARNVVEFIATRDALPAAKHADNDAAIFLAPPGRFEIFSIAGKSVILDGAHNPQKLSALQESLKLRFNGPYAWMIGFIAAPDTKIDDCVGMLANNADEFIVTQFSVGQDIKGRRSIPATELSYKFSTRGMSATVAEEPLAALEAVLATKQRTVVVSGSLYLVASIRARVIAMSTK